MFWDPFIPPEVQEKSDDVKDLGWACLVVLIIIVLIFIREAFVELFRWIF